MAGLVLMNTVARRWGTLGVVEEELELLLLLVVVGVVVEVLVVEVLVESFVVGVVVVVLGDTSESELVGEEGCGGWPPFPSESMSHRPKGSEQTTSICRTLSLDELDGLLEALLPVWCE